MKLIRQRHSIHVASGNVEEAMSEDESANECSLLFVKVNNTSHSEHTLLTVETRDYLGLHRAIAWALNGLSIRAQNAEMKRAPDGKRIPSDLSFPLISKHNRFCRAEILAHRFEREETDREIGI